MSTVSLTAIKGVAFSYVFASSSTGALQPTYTGSVPPGLTLSLSGTQAGISGTPTTAGGGVYQFSVQVNIAGVPSPDSPYDVTLTVTDPSSLGVPVITCTGATPNANGGALSAAAGSVSLQFAATNSGTNWSYAPPSGMGTGNYSNQIGALSLIGTLAPGNYSIPVACSNSAYSGGPSQVAYYTLALAVTPALPMITAPAASALSSYTGKAVSAQFSAQAYAGTVTWSAASLPPGCAINASTGLISGTPTTAGTFATIITATNSTGAVTYEADFTVASATAAPVISCPGATPTAGGGTLTATAGTVSLQFTATNGGANWSGSLPSGLSLNSTYGSVTGTLSAGSYNIVAMCSNTPYSGGATQTAQYLLALTVTPALPVISISDASGLNVTSGSSVSAQFSVQDTAGTVVWSATGLPSGCVINTSTGLVFGTPTSAGTFAATITATNSAGAVPFPVNFVVAASSTSATVAYQFLADDPTLTGIAIDTQTGAVNISRTTPYKAGDQARFALVFLKAGATVDPPAPGTVKMGFRVSGQYESDYLLTEPTFTLVAVNGDQPAYLLGVVPLSGDDLEAELKKLTDVGDTSAVTLTLMSDVRWKDSGGTPNSSATFTFQINPPVTEI